MGIEVASEGPTKRYRRNPSFQSERRQVSFGMNGILGGAVAHMSCTSSGVRS